MRGGQFSFVRTRTDNDAIESGNAARLLPRRSCMKLASGRRMAPWPGKQSIWTRTGWRQGLGAGVRRNVAASGSVAAGRRCRNSRPAARPAVAMAAGGAGARAIDPLGADRVRRRHRMLFRRGSRAARVGRSIGRDWRGSGCLCGAPASIRFSARRWHRRCICGTRHCNTADRHIGRLYRPWCLPDSHRSLAGRRSLGSRRAICARRCVGAALSLPQARSPGPWRPPSLTFWWPATDKRRHFAARMAGSLSYAPGVTPLPSRNGWPPTPIRERPRMGVWATASPAMRLVASADSAIVAWYRLSWESRHSPRTARERQ